jgi:hypothetical protein
MMDVAEALTNAQERDPGLIGLAGMLWYARNHAVSAKELKNRAPAHIQTGKHLNVKQRKISKRNVGGEY